MQQTENPRQHLIAGLIWLVAWYVAGQVLAAKCLENAALEFKRWRERPAPSTFTVPPRAFHVKPDGETDLQPLTDTSDGPDDELIPDGLNLAKEVTLDEV